MQALKYAIIGAGRIAPNHIAAAMHYGNKLRLVALCDPIPQNITTALAKAGFTGPVARYTEYQQLLETEQPDLVCVATPSGSHAQIGLAALEAGCNVIIEKPLAMSITQADALIAMAQKKNLLLCACHQNRFNKSVQKIQQAMEQGRFGKLSHIAAHVRWRRDESYYTQAAWRGKWESDGGCLLNQCIHNADLLLWFLGGAQQVFAYTANRQHPYIEGEDVGLAVLQGKNGALGLLEGTVNAYPNNLEETLYIFGEKGSVKLGGGSVNCIEHWSFADGKDDPAAIMAQFAETPPNVYGYGHRGLYGDVLRALETGTQPLVNGQEGKRALELILGIYASRRYGCPVHLPLQQFSTTEMKGVFPCS